MDLSGIRVEKVHITMWIIAAGLAGVAGILIGMKTVVDPLMGWDILLSAFAAAILGGVGRPYGALVGGLIIGLAEEISSYPFIGTEPLLNPGYKAGVAFAIMIGIYAVFRLALRNEEFRYRFDRFRLRLPVIGDLFKKVSVSRFCVLLASVEMPDCFTSWSIELWRSSMRVRSS